MRATRFLIAVFLSPAAGVLACYIVILIEQSVRATAGWHADQDDASRIADQLIPDWFLIVFYVLLCWLVVMPITAGVSRIAQFKDASPFVKALPVTFLISTAATILLHRPIDYLIVTFAVSTAVIGVPVYVSAAVASALSMSSSALR